jgi:hypothetical protein
MNVEMMKQIIMVPSGLFSHHMDSASPKTID